MTTYLERAHQAEQAATAAPWDWNVNLKSKSMCLEGSPRKGYEVVLDCARWGMDRARFRFRDAECLMVDAETLVKPLPGREHHASWRQDIDHPDANLIVKARNDYPSLLAVVAAAQKRVEGGHSDACGVPCTCGQEDLRAALAALEALP